MLQRSKVLAVILSTILFGIFIAPFIYITKYAYLSADDFCMASADFSNYFENILFWYREHNGRFVNSFFGYLPVYDPAVYKIILALSMVTFFGVIYFFLSRVFYFFHYKLKKDQVLLISTLFFIAVISLLPSLNQLFYWYSGTSAYLYSVIFFLLLIIALLNVPSGKKRYFLSAGFLTVLTIGNHELLLLLTNFMIFLLLVTSFWFEKKIRQRSFLLLLISIGTSLIVIFSPAATNRQFQYPEGGQFLYSLKMAFLSSGMFVFKNFLNLSIFLLMTGFFLLLLHWSKNLKNYRVINPLVALVVSLICLATVVFVPYYATGYLRIRSGRIGNMIHIVWWVLFFINTINIILYLKKRNLIKSNIPISFPIAVIGIFLIITLTGNRAYKDLYMDYKLNAFSNFEKDVLIRIETVRHSDSAVLKVNQIKGTRTISHTGISNDPSHWTTTCYLEAINKKYHKNYQVITLKE